MNSAENLVRSGKVAGGMDGYLMELETIEQSLLSLEQELQEREARRRSQEPGSIYYKLNEKIMRGLLSEYDRRKAKANYLMSIIAEITGERKPAASSRGVTDEQIERARAYPIESLIEVNRSGMSRCISGEHDDKHPSMQTTGNFAFCHACRFKADVIDIFMKLHGVDFPTAVRALQ